jgi:hypothetical protein
MLYIRPYKFCISKKETKSPVFSRRAGKDKTSTHLVNDKIDDWKSVQ